MSDDLDFMPAARPAGQDKRGATEAAPATTSKAIARVATPTTTATGSTGSSSVSSGTGAGATTTAAGEGSPDAPGARADLPTWNRSRRKRQATVQAEQQDDAFQRGVRSASRTVVDTPKLVIGAIVILIAVIGGGVALSNRNVSADAEATRTLEAATTAIVRGQVVPAEALTQLGESIRFYRMPIFSSEEERAAAVDEALAAARSSGRPQIEQDATLVAATRAVRAGDFDAAIAEYDLFLADVADDHPLRFLALEGKGTALEAKGELDAALEVFASIAPHPTDFYRHMALYHQGRVLEGLDRKDEAQAIYEQFFVEFPITKEEMATPLVRKRLELLDPELAAQLAAPRPSPIEGL